MKTTFKHFAFIALLFVFASVNAATYTWTGATSTDYQVATNWNPTRTTPNTTDDIIITPSSSFSVTNVPTQTINSLTINGAGINTVVLSGGSNYLTISTLFDIEANNTLDCGTLRFSAAGSNFTTSGTGTYKTANTAYNPTGKTWSFDVVYNASSLQLVAGGTYNNLTIDNSTPTSSVAAYVGGSDLTITGTLTLTTLNPQIILRIHFS